MPSVRTSLCLPTRRAAAGREVLLGLKLTGFGTGRVVALGGKIEQGESVLATAVRELAEECGLVVDETDLAHVASVSWSFPHDGGFLLTAEVFHVEHWQGSVLTSDEVDARWYAIDELPLDLMWADSREWLPRILSGERLRAEFEYGPDNVTVERRSLHPLSPEGGRPEQD